MITAVQYFRSRLVAFNQIVSCCCICTCVHSPRIRKLISPVSAIYDSCCQTNQGNPVLPSLHMRAFETGSLNFTVKTTKVLLFGAMRAPHDPC